MVSDLSRRYLILATAGIAARISAPLIGGAIISAKVRDELLKRRLVENEGDGGSFLRSSGQDELLSSPKQVAETFYALRYGGLAHRYANFWPLHLDANRLRGLDELSARDFPDLDDPRYTHRLRSLPALIRLSGLAEVAELDSDLAQEFREFIHHVHDQAFDPTAAPHRVIIDSLWGVATSSLGQSRHAWRTTVFGSGLIEDAAKVCRAFLDGEEVLVLAAISAWHFLLTYKNALADRQEYIQDRHILGKTIGYFLEHKLGQHSYWFRELADLTREHASFENMLPQLGEVIIAQGTGRFSTRVVNYVLRGRIAHDFICNQVDLSSSRSPYRLAAASKGVGSQSRDIITSYGFKLDRLDALAKDVLAPCLAIGLTREAIVSWRRQHYRSAYASSAEIVGRPVADKFRSWLAFRERGRAWRADAAKVNELTDSDIVDSISKEGPVGGLAAIGLRSAAARRNEILTRSTEIDIPVPTARELADDLAHYAPDHIAGIAEYVEEYKRHINPTLGVRMSDFQVGRATAAPETQEKSLSAQHKQREASDALTEALAHSARLSPIKDATDEERSRVLKKAREILERATLRANKAKKRRDKGNESIPESTPIVSVDLGYTGPVVSVGLNEFTRHLERSSKRKDSP